MNKSKLDRQPPALREELWAQFDEGRTISEVYGYLDDLGIETSPSGVWRFRRQWVRATEAAREFEQLSEVVVRNLAEVPEHKATRHIARLVQSGLMRALAALEDQMETSPEKTLNAFIEASKAVALLSRAEKDTVDATIRATAFAEEQARDVAPGGSPVIQVEFVPVKEDKQ